MEASPKEPRLFVPALGHKPNHLVGRNQEISDFLMQIQSSERASLNGPSPQMLRPKITLINGGKGIGKTALLLELCDWASTSGYTVIHATPDHDASADLIFQSENGPALIAVDNVSAPTTALRHLTSTYFSLAGKDRDVALILAGPTVPFKQALSDSVLSRLKRGFRVSLGPLPAGAVREQIARAMVSAGHEGDPSAVQRIARAIQGHPLLLQTVGFYLSSNTPDEALSFAQADFSDAVLRPLLSTLSQNDLEFLHQMTSDDGPTSVADLRARTGWADNYLQPYRSRLLAAGVIESPRRGYVAFALPFLREYVRNQGI